MSGHLSRATIDHLQFHHAGAKRNGMARPVKTCVVYVAFLLFLRPRRSSCRDDGNILRKLRRRSLARNNTKNCSHRRHNALKLEDKLTLWPRKISKRSSRMAYRMATLSSLAYYDFDSSDEGSSDGNGTKTHTRRGLSWEFSLDDEPSPSQYLVDHDEAPRSPPWGRKRRGIPRIVAGIVSRFRVSLCRLRCKISESKLLPVRLKPSMSFNDGKHSRAARCKHILLRKHEAGKRYSIRWVFSNWHERKAKIRWHDTDLIIATSGTAEMVLAFAGTDSAADAITNIQTLEPASHSSFFDQNLTPKQANITVDGNIHRGFLNAYARVGSGTMRKPSDSSTNSPESMPLSLLPLEDYFEECIHQQTKAQTYSTALALINDTSSYKFKKWANKVLPKVKNEKRQYKRKEARRLYNSRVCHSHGNRLLIDILRNVTTNSLEYGHTVHLVGHSLAGALAQIHALDIVLNHPTTPIDRLHLWTFGSPEIADSRFWESAGDQCPRLHDFFSDGTRFHRYVTQSEGSCETDRVASITSKSLNRPIVRRLGGVRGDVIHTVEPTILPCNATGVKLHRTSSYLSAISSSYSADLPLGTDFPDYLKDWLGELQKKIVKVQV